MASKSDSVDVKSLVATYRKDYGDKSISYGGALVDTERVPTGIFPLDLALGGGFPRSRISIIWGRESSNKTNIVLKAIAAHQRLWPSKTCIFIDIEHSFDPLWAQGLGVDTDELVIIEPAYAEQVIDMIEGLLTASDIGVVAVDSIGALMTTQEAEADASNNRPGGAALVVSKFIRKLTQGQAEANKRGIYPTILLINQTRVKIGGYSPTGEADKMPGGNLQRFAANIILKVRGMNVIDKKINAAMPAFKTVSATIEKFKCPVLSIHSKFDMVLIPHDHFRIGDCADWSLIRTYLENFGYFEKKAKGTGYVMLEEEYPTLAACEDRLYSDRDYGNEVRRELIDALLKDTAQLLVEEDKK